MSDDQSTASQKSGSGGKNITRIVVGLILLAALAAAGTDFMQKKQYEDSQTALNDRLDDSDGVPIDELPSVLKGSPKASGDPQTEDTVTYSWGVIRNYEFDVRIGNKLSERQVYSFE